MATYITHNEEETLKLGAELAKSLKKGSVIALFAELGSGKTVLTRGICSQFGITEINSPTFAIVNEYEGETNIYHIDAYRLNSEDWIKGGFDDYLFADGITVIEWADNIRDVLTEDAVMVTINKNLEIDEDYRTIEVI